MTMCFFTLPCEFRVHRAGSQLKMQTNSVKHHETIRNSVKQHETVRNIMKHQETARNSVKQCSDSHRHVWFKAVVKNIGHFYLNINQLDQNYFTIN